MVGMSELAPPSFAKRKETFFVVLLIIIALALILLLYNKRQCSLLGCLSMQGLDKFKVQEVYQEDDNAYRAQLSKDSDLLRVDIRPGISETEAKSDIQARVTKIKALFENAASPYPGEISDEIECGDEYKPVFSEERINGVQISYFTGFLNSRLVLGACTEDQAVYKEIFALFYCPKQQQFFQIELIVPKEVYNLNEDKYKQILYSIECPSD